MIHRLIGVAALFAVVLPITLFSPAQLAVVRAASCSTQNGTQPGGAGFFINLTVNIGDTISITSGIPGALIIIFPGSPMITGFGTLSATSSTAGTAQVGGTTTVAGPPYTYSITFCSLGSSNANNPPIPPFNDGRLNLWDAHETSAIYCMGDGSVRVYVPANPKWRVAFDASPAELAAVPKNPAQNTVIKSGNGAMLLRLQNGSLQIDTPALEPSKGNYSFIFQDCPVPANQATSGQPSGKSSPGMQFGGGMNLGGFGQ